MISRASPHPERGLLAGERRFGERVDDSDATVQDCQIKVLAFPGPDIHARGSEAVAPP